MVFSSLVFVYAFFPVCMLAYVACRTKQQQNVVLLIFSLFFYAWGGPKYLLLLMFMSLVSWFCAKRIARTGSRFWLGTAAVIDVALIGWFKYASFVWNIFGPVPEVVRNIALPIGISFYTFQLLTYVWDVYRKDAEAQDSYWDVLLYASLFHQCIAGPIVRYNTIAQELFSPVPRRPEWEKGAARFAIGLSKKVLLANPCGAIADDLILSTDAIANAELLTQNITALNTLPVLGAWVGVIAYSLHIYLDFSAYSDMAIGMGQMVGLHYLENFNYPYISRSVTEFWRRWHISLGTFFRDYVYIPLGGSRCTPAERVVFNTFVVWALTGLWHGASWNFVLWGLWFFVLIYVERLFLMKILKKVPVLSNLYLLMAAALGWVIFRFSDTTLMMELLRSLFGRNGNALTDFYCTVKLQNNLFLLLTCCIASTPLASMVFRKMEASDSRILHTLYYCVLPVVLLLLSTACLVGDSYNPFIYFQF